MTVGVVGALIYAAAGAYLGAMNAFLSVGVGLVWVVLSLRWLQAPD